MLIAPFLAPILTFLVREVLVKFVILTAIYAAMAVFVPVALGYIGPWIGTGSLNSSFTGLQSGIWWFLDAFNLGYGLPLLLSAQITAFVIRRLPFIG